MGKRRVILWLLLGFYPATCFAYVDPNLGGILFQWLAPVFALLVVLWGRMKFAVAALLRQIRDLFSRRQ